MLLYSYLMHMPGSCSICLEFWNTNRHTGCQKTPLVPSQLVINAFKLSILSSYPVVVACCHILIQYDAVVVWMCMYSPYTGHQLSATHG